MTPLSGGVQGNLAITPGAYEAARVVYVQSDVSA